MSATSISIRVKEVSDAPTEKALIINNQCDFSFMRLDNSLRVSTKQDSEPLQELPGWTTLMPGGKGSLKRFEVNLSLDAFINHLRLIYGENNVQMLKKK